MIKDVWRWESETIKEGTVKTAIPNDGPYLQVVSEFPVTKEGERLPRYGNRYYPTMVRVSWGDLTAGGEEATHLLLIEDAQAIGEALIKAAQIAKEVDDADSDTCGHWAPCTCEVALSSKELR